MTVLSLPSATFACVEYFFDWGDLGWDGKTTGVYPYKRIFTNVDGSGIDVTLTIPRQHRSGDIEYTSTPPQNLDTYTGSTTAFRFYRPNDAIIDTITLDFSQPIVAGPMVFGGSRQSSGAGGAPVQGTLEFRAYRAGSVVLPNSLVHPNPTTTTDIVRGTALSDPAGAGLTMTHNTGLGNDLNGAYATGRSGVDDGYVIVGLTVPEENRNWGIVDYQGVEVDSLSWEIWQSTVVDPLTARAPANIGTGGYISGYFGSFKFVKAGTCDLGDLPDTYNATMRHNNGARHVIGQVFLGAAIDSEGNGQKSAGADGDDNDEGDDEDGVVFRTPAGGGHNVFADVTLANSTGSEVTLYGWLDTNGDGTFDDDSERKMITTDVQSTSFEWMVSDTTAQTYYARFRVCSIQSECSSALGTASDGEVEDYAINYDPTEATIGKVTLFASSVEDYLTMLGQGGMSDKELLDLLAAWDADMAASLASANRGAIEAAVREYLDPDGDGQVAILRWETLSERGTIGFYVERRANDGGWKPINSEMLPAMISAPLGAQYIFADPSAVEAGIYYYRFIEQEAWGTTQPHGPFMLELK